LFYQEEISNDGWEIIEEEKKIIVYDGDSS
jgi:hypothetical protein